MLLRFGDQFHYKLLVNSYYSLPRISLQDLASVHRNRLKQPQLANQQLASQASFLGLQTIILSSFRGPKVSIGWLSTWQTQTRKNKQLQCRVLSAETAAHALDFANHLTFLLQVATGFNPFFDRPKTQIFQTKILYVQLYKSWLKNPPVWWWFTF